MMLFEISQFCGNLIVFAENSLATLDWYYLRECVDLMEI